VKPGVRALGLAESYAQGGSATVAGCVVRADRTVDGIVFSTWTVGGTDSTGTVVDCWDRLGRADIQYLLVAGIAPAWFNVLDLRAVHDAVDRPVLSVSFEPSEGLEPALRESFEGAALEERLATYRRQPDREPVAVDDGTVFVRAVGCDSETAARVVRAFTPEGERPEPVRVARLAARAGDGFRERLGEE
jgi:endonuclease V-like protein UPF0215 family